MEDLTTSLGTLDILTNAWGNLPERLPALTTIGGLANRVVNLAGQTLFRKGSTKNGLFS